MKVALVHDWLPVFSGAERVLAEIMRVVGASDLYTLYDFLDDRDRAAIGAKKNLHERAERPAVRRKILSLDVSVLSPGHGGIQPLPI